MKHSIKKEFKKYIYYLIASFDIIRLLILTKNHKEKYFFLQVEGGFGFTISSPHFLNIHYGNKWILLFGFRKANHNNEVVKLYNGKLKFFRVGNLNQSEFRYSFEKFVQKYLQKFFKIKIINMRDYLFSFPHPDSSNNEKYLSLPDSRQNLVFKKNKSNFYLDNKYKNSFKKSFEKFHGNFKGIINFFLRGKGKKHKSKKFLEKIKDARDIENFKPTLEFLVEDGWQIFLTGEEFEIPNWIKEKKNSIIYQEKTEFDLGTYNMFVANNQDIFIGSSSGAGVLNLLNPNCKSLLLECGHIGCGYINTVASYPKIKFKSLAEFSEILYYSFCDNIFLEKLYNSGKVEYLNPLDLKNITLEFIKNINSEDYFSKASDLGLNKGVLFDCETKISKYWLDKVNYNNLKK